MKQLPNCYSQKRLSKQLDSFGLFFVNCETNSHNDLMKRLICLIDTLIDSLRHLFRHKQKNEIKETIIAASFCV